ncbi:EF hand domain-containing protein [Humitalea rosea]|uniref:EF hand domain-containing protein n=1 Tax=Humitalea rosea TaxID=990373 RepID=A0A2W7I7J9_9PROT|nr:EF-hand domain-containing protein [Humitalea rosea]PZW42138.1 EF hand domain-containing protein [Humitalea rosea]
MIASAGGAGMDMAQIREIRAQLFKKADADQSGGLTLSEFTALGQSLPGGPAATAGTSATDAAQAMFSRRDTDGDGSLTEAEMDVRRPPEGGGLGPDVLAALFGQQESSQAATGGGQVQALMQQLLRSLQQNGGRSAAASAPLSA